MPYYQNYTLTTANQFLIDLAVFVAANGWTVDFDGVYNTSYRRLHFHQGEMHCDLYTAASGSTYKYHCTGYDAGSAPSAQPGVGAGGSMSLTTTNYPSYWLVSTVGAVWIALGHSTGYHWGAIWSQIDKLGTWPGGFGSKTPSSPLLFADGCGVTGQGSQIYANGSWGTPSGAGALSGSGGDVGLVTKQPVPCNSGIVLIPVLISSYYAADTTKRVPLGLAPGLYRAMGGDIYNSGDEIIIGDDTYLMLPSSTGGVAAGAYLFKLGA